MQVIATEIITVRSCQMEKCESVFFCWRNNSDILTKDEDPRAEEQNKSIRTSATKLEQETEV